jgi:hypothetical protein
MSHTGTAGLPTRIMLRAYEQGKGDSGASVEEVEMTLGLHGKLA